SDLAGGGTARGGPGAPPASSAPDCARFPRRWTMRRRRHAPLLLLLALGLAFAFDAARAAAQPGPLAGLDAYIEQALKDWEVPGLALAIVKDDSVIHARGYGVRELGRPAAVDARTLFAIGSASKAFTAALIGMAVEEGKLKRSEE